ncbi:MAG: alpha/beta hydrolase [Dehalococcoidia bacterium]
MQQRDIEANGLTFRAREHGDGTPVLLLHGFPETSRMWEPLMERLAAEGFHCLAPDQRGYSPGARPEGESAYRYTEMASDVFAFMDAMGWERAHLIGHDWGAAAGWAAVGTTPERVLSWVPMSVPHLRAFGTAIRENEEQQQKSGYINFFRQVGTAETVLSANDFQALRDLYKATHAQDEIDEYISVLSQEGALTAALNWYRGSEGIRPDRDDGAQWGPVAVPALLIWGNQDMAIGRDATLACAQHMTGPYELLELDCGHWIAQEAFDQIAGPIVEHLKKHS